MEYVVKKIVSEKQIPKKDGSGVFTVSNVLTEDDQVFEVTGQVKEGQTLSGEIEDTKFGKRFKAAGSSQAGAKRSFGKSIEERWEMARENALTNTVARMVAKADILLKIGDDKAAIETLSGTKILQMAFYLANFNMGNIKPDMTPEKVAEIINETYEVEKKSQTPAEAPKAPSVAKSNAKTTTNDDDVPTQVLLEQAEMAEADEMAADNAPE